MRRFVNPGKRIASFTRSFARLRWALNFDGVGVRGALSQRAINPDGDNSFEFYAPSAGGLQSIIMQTLSTSGAGREFGLYFDSNLNGGTLIMNYGGAFNSLCNAAQGFEIGKKYWLTLIGTTFSLAKENPLNVVRSGSFTRGAVREPAAVTIVGSLSNGSGGFSSFFQGVQRDVKINGVRWPMADRNQTIQLPEPSGLGAELLVNPSVASDGSSWGKDSITVQSLSSNHFRLTNARSSYAGAIFQTIPTTIGNKYVIRFKVGFQTAGTNFRVSINSTAAAQYTGDLLAANYTVSDQYLFVVFIATTTSATVRLLCNSSGAGSYVDVLDLTVKPLDTCNPMTISNATSANWMQVVDDYVRKFRKVLRFDGVGVRGALANRAIDPDGDIDIEWEQRSVDTSSIRGIVTQCLASNWPLREFNLRWVSGALMLSIGGVDIVSSSDNVLSTNGRWRVVYAGDAISVYLNGALVFASSGRSRGAARESGAKTNIGFRDAAGSYLEHTLGYIYNLKINGILWPIADANQTIQLPEPSGLGEELITPYVLENPALAGNQWSYLGNGRWRLVSDGTLNDLIFVLAMNQPESGYVEFEIEYITGSITCSQNAVGGSVFSDAGLKRFLYTSKGVSNANVFIFKRANNTSPTCIIKNISFKPLGTCNPITLANVTSANWEDLEV